MSETGAWGKSLKDRKPKGSYNRSFWSCNPSRPSQSLSRTPPSLKHTYRCPFPRAIFKSKKGKKKKETTHLSSSLNNLTEKKKKKISSCNCWLGWKKLQLREKIEYLKMAGENKTRNDYYEALGVKKECSLLELKNAYKKLALVRKL